MEDKDKKMSFHMIDGKLVTLMDYDMDSLNVYLSIEGNTICIKDEFNDLTTFVNINFRKDPVSNKTKGKVGLTYTSEKRYEPKP